MRRISAAGAIAAFLITTAVGWAAPPKPAPKPEVSNKPATPTRQDVANSLEQEQKVLLDRMNFCTRLRQIAAETNDDSLAEKADQLEKQAFELFSRKTASLQTIMLEVKAAEARLEEGRKNPTSANGSASNDKRITGRAPNGRPIIPKE